jgi:putative redox protein
MNFMAINVKTTFTSDTEGVVVSTSGQADISFTGKNLAPYEFFLGGYAGCLHATFKDILNKKKISFDEITYDITGVKREEIPTTLKEVTVLVSITGASKEKQKAIRKSMELAEKYCSISAMIQMIANIDIQLSFLD